PAHQALLQSCTVSLPAIASCGARLPNLEAILRNWCHYSSESTLAIQMRTGRKRLAQFLGESQPAWSAPRHRVGPRMVNEKPVEPGPHWDQGALDLVRTLDLHRIPRPSSRHFLIPWAVPDLAVLTRAALDSCSWRIPASSSAEIDCQAQTSNQTGAGRTCPSDQPVCTLLAREWPSARVMVAEPLRTTGSKMLAGLDQSLENQWDSA